MGRKSSILIAALIAGPVCAQDTGNVLVNGGFQQGLTGWYETGPGGVYDGCGPAGGYCYVFSYATGVLQQTFVAKTTYTGYIVGFDYRLPCNNSIGGYCSNPFGPRDWLTADLSLYLGQTQVQSVSLLSVQAYQPTYETFSLTGTAPSAFDTATLTFKGQDTGFWAGPYGPQIDRVSLTLTNPVETAAAEPAFAPVPTAPTAPASPSLASVAQVEALFIVDEVLEEPAIVSDISADVVSETTTVEASEESISSESAPPPPGVLAALGVPAQDGPAAAEARRDRNADFFGKEAIRDANQFDRETVLAVATQSIAFLAQADAQYAQQFGEQSTTETAGETYHMEPTDGAPTFMPSPVTGMSDVTAPAGQARQIELLGMQTELSTNPMVNAGDATGQDAETMAQLAVAPAGYGSYTQARIPDAPFYQPRDIYKGRRIPDANLQLYRMLQGQDRRWDDMVEDQYE